jgi:hypothetical protein
MSQDDDFERFLETARVEHEASALPPETTKRIDGSIARHVSWRRALPAGVATALATTEASAAARRQQEGSDGPAKSPPSTRGLASKVIGVIAPVIGLAVVYSVTTERFAGRTSDHSIEPAPLGPAAPLVESAPTPAAPSPTAPSSEVSLPVLAAPSELPDVKEVPGARPNRPSKPAASYAGRPTDGSLEAELALLAEVTSALQANRAARALTLIDEHDRRFPKGALVPEFAAQRVVTLAALGRHAEACTRSAAFLAAYPKSPLVPQVRSSCVDPTSSH